MASKISLFRFSDDRAKNEDFPPKNQVKHIVFCLEPLTALQTQIIHMILIRLVGDSLFLSSNRGSRSLEHIFIFVRNLLYILAS